MTPENLEKRSAAEAIRHRQQEAFLGLEVQRQVIYKDGPLNFILASAFSEAVDAMLELVEKDPSDIDGVRKLQNDVKRYGDIARWMCVAVTEGEQAHQLLSQTDIPDGWEKAFTAQDGATNE